MAGAKRISLPPALTRFVWALAGMALLSLGYTLAMTRLLHAPHPYGVTLFRGRFVGSDLATFAERSAHFRTLSYWNEFNYPLTYPAPMGVFLAMLFRLPHPLACYLALCVAGFAAWAGWLARQLTSRGVRGISALGLALCVLVAAWPPVLLLNTANTEGLVAILLGSGVLAVLRDRPWLGATLLGLATSLKLYPFILLALLLAQRRWKPFAWGVAVAALATLASLALLGPNIVQAQRQIDAGLRFLTVAFILPTRRDALNYSHSLFSILKFAVALAGRLLHHPASERLLGALLKLYLAAAALAGVALYFLRIRALPLLNQLLALTVCAVLLPPLSADYTLLELLLPFGLLCLYATEAWQRRESPPGVGAAFLCFAVIFGWETFFTLHYALDRPVRGCALVYLLVIVLRHPWSWPVLDQRAELPA